MSLRSAIETAGLCLLPGGPFVVLMDHLQENNGFGRPMPFLTSMAFGGIGFLAGFLLLLAYGTHQSMVVSYVLANAFGSILLGPQTPMLAFSLATGAVRKSQGRRRD